MDKSAITLSLFDMHLTPFAFCRWTAMGKKPEAVGGRPTMFVQIATNTAPVIVASDVFLWFTLEHNGRGRKNRAR